MIVTVVLENGEVLKLKEKQRDFNLHILEGDYALTGSYKLYKRKANVICGEEVPYKSLDIHIEK